MEKHVFDPIILEWILLLSETINFETYLMNCITLKSNSIQKCFFEKSTFNWPSIPHFIVQRIKDGLN